MYVYMAYMAICNWFDVFKIIWNNKKSFDKFL